MGAEAAGNIPCRVVDILIVDGKHWWADWTATLSVCLEVEWMSVHTETVRMTDVQARELLLELHVWRIPATIYYAICQLPVASCQLPGALAASGSSNSSHSILK